MERGEKLPEEAIPRRAGKIHGDPSHSEAPTFTSSTALCYTGERHTNTRAFNCHRPWKKKEEMHILCPKRCENIHGLLQMQGKHLQGTCKIYV